MIEILLNSYLEIIILLFAGASIITIFLSMILKNEFQNLLKASAFLAIIATILIANDTYVYLLGLFLLGTAVTSTEFLLGIIREWKTNTKVEKHVSSNVTIDNKTLIKE